MIKQHASLTESKVAGFIMSDFDNQLAHFVKVFPRDYKAVLLQKEKNNQKAI
jgi:glutamate synthase (NADPH/NADH) large chain